MSVEINEAFARKVLGVVDAGLVSGLGEPTPGKMCVEAAVNYAMGKPHGDEPDCVSPALRRLKIKLNDSRWSTDSARTKGLRRLAIAQLGSADVLDEKEFTRRGSVLAIQFAVPFTLRAAASMKGNGAFKDRLLAAADLCEREPVKASANAAAYAANAAYAAYAADDANAAYAAYAAYAANAAYAAYADAAYAAYAAANAAYAAANAANAADDADSFLADFCERVVQILIDLKAPGCEFLWLTEYVQPPFEGARP